MNVAAIGQDVCIPGIFTVSVPGDAPGTKVLFEATLKVSATERVHRMIVVNESIRQAAAHMLQLARAQLDQAAFANTQLYAEGASAFYTDEGRRIQETLAHATARAVLLQHLVRGTSDLGAQGGVDVYDWRSLLRYFDMPMDTGAVPANRSSNTTQSGT